MPLFRFVQLEFTHAVGIPVGAYTVDVKPGADGLGVGDADALVVELVEGGASLLVATLVFATDPLSDSEAGAAQLSQLRSDRAAQQASLERTLLVVNRGVRAYRIAALDPYVTEVMELDPRTVRFGYGEGGSIGAGKWLDAFELEREALKPPKPRDLEHVQIGAMVGASLAGTARLLEAEELALRALLDLRHDRVLAAAAGARAAAEVLKLELGSDGDSDAAMPPDSAATEALALHVLKTGAASRSQT